MIAVDGIGNGNPIDTTIATLAALNTTGGAINVTETDGLTIGGPVGTTTGVTNNAAGGQINIVTLANNITVAANVTANDGATTLAAEDSVIQNTGTTIDSNGGEIHILADTNDGGDGGITQNGSAVIDSDGGNITLMAGTATGGDDIALTLVDAADTGVTGHVTITTFDGAILDNDAADNNDVVADDLTLFALNGLGSPNPIDTMAYRLQA